MKISQRAVVIILAGIFVAPHVVNAASYYVDQCVTYAGSACGGASLFDDTTAIVSRMNAASWAGSKYIDNQAYARDWRESCSSTYGFSGTDNVYTDAVNFSIFSGHGSTSTLYFTANVDVCGFNIDNQSRLGAMGGSSAGVAMYISCDTLDLNGSGQPLAGGLNWLRQQLGFHGLTGNQTSAYGSFFDDTSTKSNAQAWMDRLPTQPAVAISYETGSGNCWTVDAGAKLKAKNYVSARANGPACNGGQPAYTYCVRKIN